MSNFIYDDDFLLPDTKYDAGPLTGPPEQSLRAWEFNSVTSALGDIRTYLRGGAAMDVVNVREFGAVGDGKEDTDDTEAILFAVEVAQASGKALYFPTPPNFYSIKKPIVLQAEKPIVVFSDGLRTAEIRADAPMEAIFLFDDAAESGNAGFDFRNLYLNGNKNAKCGIKSNKINTSRFRRLLISATTDAALHLSHGWALQIDDCQMAQNQGDGIRLTGRNNNCSVLGCKIDGNKGLGIHALGGSAEKADDTVGLRIEGCTLQNNAGAAIYLQRSCAAVRVIGNHFEGNAASGFEFRKDSTQENPKLTIRAEIILNGSATVDVIDKTDPCRNLVIENNVFNPNSDQTATNDTPELMACIYAISTNALKISSNYAPSSRKVTLLGVHGDNDHAEVISTQFDNTNLDFERLIDVVNRRLFHVPMLHTTLIEGVNPQNYFPRNEEDVKKVVDNDGWGSLDESRQPAPEGKNQVWELKGNDIYGFKFDPNDYPELIGKLIQFSAWIGQGPDYNGVLYYAHNVDIPELAGESAQDIDFLFPRRKPDSVTWERRSLTTIMPKEGTVVFGFARICRLEADKEEARAEKQKIYICKPVLTVIGVNPDSFWVPRT